MFRGELLDEISEKYYKLLNVENCVMEHILGHQQVMNECIEWWIFFATIKFLHDYITID